MNQENSKQTSIVPCNGCTACCKNEAVLLQPEDDPALYKTIDVPHPFTGEPVKMIDHKPNGDCIYLGVHGCGIYANRPVVCKAFDCRKLFLQFSKETRRKLVKAGKATKDRFDAGKKRVDTLPADQRDAMLKKRI